MHCCGHLLLCFYPFSNYLSLYSYLFTRGNWSELKRSPMFPSFPNVLFIYFIDSVRDNKVYPTQNHAITQSCNHATQHHTQATQCTIPHAILPSNTTSRTTQCHTSHAKSSLFLLIGDAELIEDIKRLVAPPPTNFQISLPYFELLCGELNFCFLNF
jgi:hypothetical protein